MPDVADFLDKRGYRSLDDMLRRKNKRGPPAGSRLTERDRAIMAARKRGWSLDQIAFACGVSCERIRQLLARKNIIGTVKLSRRASQGMKVEHKCPRCGKATWRPKSNKSKFCSRLCASLDARRTGGRLGTVAAIEMRLKGMAWMAIEKATGHRYQSYAGNIWWLLHEYALLDVGIVERLFSRRAQADVRGLETPA